MDSLWTPRGSCPVAVYGYVIYTLNVCVHLTRHRKREAVRLRLNSGYLGINVACHRRQVCGRRHCTKLHVQEVATADQRVVDVRGQHHALDLHSQRASHMTEYDETAKGVRVSCVEHGIVDAV